MEQVKQLYSNALVGILATVINSLVLAFIQRDVTSRTTLIAWVALLAVVTLWRYKDVRTFYRRSLEAPEASRWGRRFIVCLALSGMVWGSAAIFLFPVESLAHQTFLAFVIGGMVAGAAAAFSSVMKAFLAYSVPALSPIIVRFALLGDEFHLAMGGMTLLFGVMMFFIAMQIHTARITSLKLRFENRGLVTLNSDLDDFTYVASHDLQEPLRNLAAFSQLLRKDLGDSLPEGAARNLGFITETTKRMQTLIDGLLALLRTGRTAQRKEMVSLSECADRALEGLALRVKETGAEVTRDRLPMVCGDPTLLTELYQNLIGNALKFTREQRPIIRLTVEEQGGERVFGVKDNGIGINPKYAQQIFQPFRRLHGRAEFEGAGMGLAICRTIVERHGGNIWVESEPGKGAHFRFTILHGMTNDEDAE